MVKFMGILSLRPGVDPDETWRLWPETHSASAKAKLLPEVKKYTIARVISTLPGFEDKGIDIYGMSQMLFDDVESAQRAFGRWINSPPDDFLTNRFTNVRRIIVEEKEIEL